MMSMNKYGKSRLYIIVRPIVSVLFKLIYHPKIVGKDLINIDDGIVLAGNHTSILDCLLLMSSTKREIHFLAKSELFTGFKSIIFSNMGLIPVDRSKKNPNALKDAVSYLNNNEVVLVFPEGTTEKGRGLMDFKIGAVKMANDSNKKIIPFVIHGKYNIFGKSIRLTFLDPMEVKSNLEYENDKLHKKIEAVLEENNI